MLPPPPHPRGPVRAYGRHGARPAGQAQQPGGAPDWPLWIMGTFAGLGLAALLASAALGASQQRRVRATAR